MHQHGDTTHAIHERMVQLDYEGGTFAIHSLDHDRLPGRKLRIETDGGHRLGQVEHLPEGGVVRQEDAPKMKVEIETVVRDELRPSAAKRSGLDSGPEPRDEVDQHRHPISDVCPTGGLLQCHHGDDRRPQYRSRPMVHSKASEPLIVSATRTRSSIIWQLPHLIVRPNAAQSQCRKSHPSS